MSTPQMPQAAQVREAYGATTPRGSTPADWKVPLATGAVFGLVMGIVLLRRGVEPWALLSCYVATVAVLALAFYRSTGENRDVSLPLLALLASVAAGPVGAFGVGFLGATSALRSPSDLLLQAWYERIALATAVDPVTRLCEDVVAGRSINLAAAEPVCLHALMATGKLHERQSVLGIIARRFHPDYLPILVQALRSEMAVVRVQAAAVAAHLRPTIATWLASTLVAAHQPDRRRDTLLRDLAQIEALCACGLLDEGDRKRGAAEAHTIKARLAEAFIAANGHVLKPALLPREAAMATLEQALLDRGNLAALRSLRAASHALGGRPKARVRRIAAPAPAPAPARPA